MAYTDVATKSNGNVITSTDMNTYIRDNMRAFNRWTPYSPNWIGSTTNPAIGNGHLVGNYIKFEQWCLFEVHITFGSTTTAGNGVWTISLPFTARTGPTNYRQLIPAVSLDDGTAWYVNSTATLGSGATVFETQAAHNLPFTWGVNDVYHAQGMYRTN